ncbi:putative paraoxonase [Xylariomycetidae sp. FL2044]|nr:putative paraoxonase [Xylariomycetidae sp. FL2044]
MSPIQTTLAVLLLASLSPLLYSRLQILSLLYTNAPERFIKINTFGAYEIKFADQIRSCEDVVLVESEGLAILGCDPGRERWNTVMGIFLPGPVGGGALYLYDYRDPKAPDEVALRRMELLDYEPGADFHSLGKAYDEATGMLFVANHRHDTPAVDVFKVDLAAATAKHVRSIQHPLLHAPNAIKLINDHELYVTNDKYFTMLQSRPLSELETYLGIPGGSVVHLDISPEDRVEANVLARVPFANGIEILNDTTVVVASSSTAGVYFFNVTRHPTDPARMSTLEPVRHMRLPYLVDNLSLASDGRLMMAGHPHVGLLNKFAKSRHICNDPEALATAGPKMQRLCNETQAMTMASEWTEGGGVRHIYADSEFPTGCTAVRDVRRKMGIIAGLYGKGILVWRD